MLREYHAGRRQSGRNPLGVGVIAVGSIDYLQDREFFYRLAGGRAVWRNRHTGRWEDM
jgi:hypothetical protein